MLIYFVHESDIHKPIKCIETNYNPIPRVGEKVVFGDTLAEVSAVYHNLDYQEIKIVIKQQAKKV